MQNLKSSVLKTFAILENFTSEKQSWGVTELANSLGSNKSTVYRFLSDLESLDILYKDPVTEKYSLGLKLFELGNRVSINEAFIEKVHPVLEEVVSNITETVHLAVLKDEKVFYVDKVESPLGLKISSHIASYNPAYCTSLGKILLAYKEEFLRSNLVNNILKKGSTVKYTDNTILNKKDFITELNRVRINGFAIDKEEFEIGLICVAVPVFNSRNEVVASLSASGPANRFKQEELVNYVSMLRQGADQIQSRIGTFKI